MTTATPRQLELHAWMLAYQAKHGAPPTLREIGAHFGIRSSNCVHGHLVSMEKKGLVRRRPNTTRGWLALVLDSTPPAFAPFFWAACAGPSVQLLPEERELLVELREELGANHSRWEGGTADICAVLDKVIGAAP